MIPLGSPDWHHLRHAYGPASDIPELLRALAQHPRPARSTEDQPWFSLWSALCHQGDVYSASFAAVPHIVEIGVAATGPIDFSFYLLPASVEVSRRKRPESIPSAEIEGSYFAALRGLHECAFRHAADGWDRTMMLAVAAALSAATGDTQLAEALMNLDEVVISRLAEEEL